MSKKDMLGSLKRALVGLPVQHHGLVLDVANKLSTGNGDAIHSALVLALCEVVKPKFDVLADGTITFTVTSDGTTGLEWIGRLKAAGHKVNDYTEQLLRSSDFVPTNGMTTKIAVLPGKLWTTNSNRLTKNIRAEALKRKLVKPNVEVACLIRMMFTNEEIRSMGLHRLVIMHKPINDVGGSSGLLTVGAGGSGSWLGAYWDDPDYRWDSQDGFVFAVPQV